jgi:hypothetical protein
MSSSDKVLLAIIFAICQAPVFYEAVKLTEGSAPDVFICWKKRGRRRYFGNCPIKYWRGVGCFISHGAVE